VASGFAHGDTLWFDLTPSPHNVISVSLFLRFDADSVFGQTQWWFAPEPDGPDVVYQGNYVARLRH